MKRVRLNKLNLGDVIHFEGRFWLVDSVNSRRVLLGRFTYVDYIVKIHDCDDIFYTRYLTNNHRFYTVM